MSDADPAFPAGSPAAPLLRALAEQVRDLVAVTDLIGTISWSNARFAAATGFVPGTLARSLLAFSAAGPAGTRTRLALAALLAAPEGEAGDLALQSLDGSTLWVDVRVGAIDGQLLWTLSDVSATHRLTEQAKRQGELLETAQQFGRLRIWERAIPAADGRWDDPLFGFWGLDPSHGTPSSEQAIARIHPDDRARMSYAESTRRAGRYAQRYRVVHPDGATRWIHSQWEVKTGRSGIPDRAVGILMDDTEPYEAARALDEATTQLRMAVELGKISIWRHDLRTDLMFCTDRGFELLGMPPRPEGHLLSEVRSYIHPDDIADVVASSRAALRSDEPADTETRYRRADGTWRYVLTRRVVERNAAGAPLAFVGVALDMTERIEHLRHAEELARRLEAASQAAGVGIWSTTLVPEEADWNAQMFVLFDRHAPPHVPSFAHWLDASVHADDRERIGPSARDYLLHSTGRFEIEFRTLRRDDTCRWMVMRADIDASRPGERRILGVAMDVTERHEALDALREASRRAAFITRHAGIGMWEADLANDIERWDDRMFELRDLRPAGRVPGRAERLALVHPADRRLVLDSTADLSDPSLPSSYEFRVRLGGSYRWLASRSVVVFDDAGRPVRRVGVNWDVTEGKNADLARQQAELAEREVQAKSQFLSRMSHELRTPLNAVLGFTQLLQIEARRSGDGAQLAKLAHVRAAGDHLLSLINDVLDLSGIESGELRLQLRAVDLGELVREALPLLHSLADQHGVAIDNRSEGGNVHADPTRLRQVLINLVSNAIKYNRHGGSVVVETEAGAGEVLLRVRDTGRGLSKEQLARLFEPFNRFGVEHEGIEGTGIGLTIVKALVDGMSGRIVVASEPGAGTVFEVRLPAADSSAVPATAEPVEAAWADTGPPLPSGLGTILYIEDNPVNVLLVEELVRTVGGLSFASEPTGAAGVARAELLQPDLVLVDLQLPDFDGYEVLRRLRAGPLTRGIRCVALSANAMPDDMARGLAAGFTDYWTKPIDFAVFVTALKKLFPNEASATSTGRVEA